MARASAWGLGTALAYRALPVEEQAELLALYVAARSQEGDEAEGVLIRTLSHLVAGSKEASAENPPGKPVQNKATPMFPPSARPKLSPADLLRAPE